VPRKQGRDFPARCHLDDHPGDKRHPGDNLAGEIRLEQRTTSASAESLACGLFCADAACEG
jgi:hypothetical protein